MPTNFRQFEREVANFGSTLLPEQFVLFQKKIALEVLVRVVKRTPVDTGRARGNWQVGVGTIPSGNSSADSTGGSTISAGLGNLATLGRNQTVFIANNLEYISFLEGGSSTQAARGMLAVSLQEVEMQFKGVA
tara:strand:- start:50218 stop:50616 length:399 start_codon:yes stop_codon:yes gene_type:complete